MRQPSTVGTTTEPPASAPRRLLRMGLLWVGMLTTMAAAAALPIWLLG